MLIHAILSFLVLTSCNTYTSCDSHSAEIGYSNRAQDGASGTIAQPNGEDGKNGKDGGSIANGQDGGHGGCGFGFGKGGNGGNGGDAE